MKQKYSSKELRERMKEDELELLMEGTSAWFRRYGQALTFAAVVVVIGFAGYYFYQSHKKSQTEEAIKAYNAASAEFDRGNLEQAGIAFDRLAQEYGNTGAGKQARVAAAQAYFDAAQYDRAAERYNQLVQSRDELLLSAGLTGLAQVQEAQGNRKDAIELYQKAITEHPGSGFVERWRFGVGYNYEMLGETEKAIEAYRAVPDDSALKMQAVQRLAWLLAEPHVAQS